MKSSREIVVPVCNNRNFAILAIIFGVASGGLAIILPVLVSGGERPLDPAWQVTLTAFLIGPAVFSIMTAITVPRIKDGVLFGALLWAVLGLAFSFLDFFLAPSGGAHAIVTPSWVLISFPVAILLGIIGSLWHFALLIARRTFVAQLIEDDGTRCVRCAYEINSPRIERCPECGEPVTSKVYHWQRFRILFSAVLQRVRLIAVVLIISAVPPSIWIITTRTIPAGRFFWQFRDGDFVDYLRVGAWLDKDAGTMLLLEYSLQDSPDSTPLKAEMARLVVGPGYKAIGVGYPRITWLFSREQAQYVVKNGFPSIFLEEVSETISLHEWTTVLPATGIKPPVSMVPRFDPSNARERP